MTSRQWGPIVAAARDIVNGYGYRITLRQLHYRLVMTPGLGYRNVSSDYKRLSSLTAEGRRQGTFPALLDQTREVHREPFWTSPRQALDDLAGWYRLDRTQGQAWQIILGGEKATLLAQFESWFSDRGFPVALLRGYGSQTYLDDVARLVRTDKRPAVLLYVGDFDPSGEDILRDFVGRCPVWEKVEHVAVRPEQVDALGLVVNRGKATDSRAAAFVARHGELVQVEAEAIPPDQLRQMYLDAIGAYWDMSHFDRVRAREAAHRARLVELADDLDPT